MIDIENDLEKILEPGKKPEEYLQTYLDLVEQCKSRGLDKSKADFYTEIHHIVPRCKGGTNDKENLIMFSALEHIVAHLLLFLYDESDTSFKLAAWSMLNLFSENTMERPITIKKYLNILTKSRELVSKKLGKTIVCYERYSTTVIRIYSSIVSGKVDGFDSSGIKRVLGKTEKSKSVTHYKNYRFEYIDKFINDCGIEPINIYKNLLDSGNLPKIIYHDSRYYGHENKLSKKVVAFLLDIDNSPKIQGTFLSIKEAEKIIGTSIVLRKANLHKAAGYFWMEEAKFDKKFPGKLKEYRAVNNEVNKPLPILSRGRAVVCYENEDTHRVLQVVDKIDNLRNYNFNPSTISAACLKKVRSKTHYYKGYYWMYLEEFEKSYPDQLKVFNIDANLNKVFIKGYEYSDNATKIVKLDIETYNILKIYPSGESVKFDGFSPTDVRNAAGILRDRKTHYNKGYHWMYLDDFAVQYPEKLEEYYKTHEDERPQN